MQQANSDISLALKRFSDDKRVRCLLITTCLERNTAVSFTKFPSKFTEYRWLSFAINRMMRPDETRRKTKLVHEVQSNKVHMRV